jgi:hypothetical protein
VSTVRTQGYQRSEIHAITPAASASNTNSKEEHLFDDIDDDQFDFHTSS